jgi:hypothetical protein
VLERLTSRQDEAKVAIKDEDPRLWQLVKGRHRGIIGARSHTIRVGA